MGVVRPQNLNDVFYAASQQAKQKLPELSHGRKVTNSFHSRLGCMYEDELLIMEHRDMENPEAIDFGILRTGCHESDAGGVAGNVGACSR
jgi:hypothetical protein